MMTQTPQCRFSLSCDAFLYFNPWLQENSSKQPHIILFTVDDMGTFRFLLHGLEASYRPHFPVAALPQSFKVFGRQMSQPLTRSITESITNSFTNEVKLCFLFVDVRRLE